MSSVNLANKLIEFQNNGSLMYNGQPIFKDGNGFLGVGALWFEKDDDIKNPDFVNPNEFNKEDYDIEKFLYIPKTGNYKVTIVAGGGGGYYGGGGSGSGFKGTLELEQGWYKYTVGHRGEYGTLSLSKSSTDGTNSKFEKIDGTKYIEVYGGKRGRDVAKGPSEGGKGGIDGVTNNFKEVGTPEVRKEGNPGTEGDATNRVYPGGASVILGTSYGKGGDGNGESGSAVNGNGGYLSIEEDNKTYYTFTIKDVKSKQSGDILDDANIDITFSGRTISGNGKNGASVTVPAGTKVTYKVERGEYYIPQESTITLNANKEIEIILEIIPFTNPNKQNNGNENYTKSIYIHESGNYKVTIVAGGGGGFYGGGGSGSGFKGTLYLEQGWYTYTIGYGGKYGTLTSESTDGTNSKLQAIIGGKYIEVYGGQRGKNAAKDPAEGGKGGTNGVTNKFPEVGTPEVRKEGNSGTKGGIVYKVYPGGDSVISGTSYGKGGDGNGESGSAVKGSGGYLSIEKDPDSYYTYTITASPTDANITINSSKGVTVTGKGKASITVSAGTKVTYQVEKQYYKTESGNTTVNSNQTKNITLAKNTHIYTIKANNGAKIEITGGNAEYVNKNASKTGTGQLKVEVYEGNTTINWKVSKEHYNTQNGTIKCSDADYTVNVNLEKTKYSVGNINWYDAAGLRSKNYSFNTSLNKQNWTLVLTGISASINKNASIEIKVYDQSNKVILTKTGLHFNNNQLTFNINNNTISKVEVSLKNNTIAQTMKINNIYFEIND